MTLPLLPDRECGGCVECCRVIPLSLPELSKPTGELCAYCSEGAGCSVHAIRPQTCRIWFCLWRAVDLSDDWRPDRSGVIIRPDGVQQGEITLYVVRRSDFLWSQGFLEVVAGWIESGLTLALSVPGPVGTFPTRAVVTDWLRPVVETGNRDLLGLSIEKALDRLDAADFEPDGVVAHYGVV